MCDTIYSGGSEAVLINYNAEDLESVVLSFKNATGINLKIVNEIFGGVKFSKEKTSNPYCSCIQNTKHEKKQCVMCDTALLDKCKKTGKAVSHVCHAGLIDIAIPIYFEESIVGYALLAQIKTEADFEKIKKKFSDEILSIEYISKETHISKSSLYQLFHRHYSCTVSAFINEERIKKSCDLLLCSEKSIEDIASGVAYSSATYYIRVFKKLKGMSPLQYRKSRDLFKQAE